MRWALNRIRHSQQVSVWVTRGSGAGCRYHDRAESGYAPGPRNPTGL